MPLLAGLTCMSVSGLRILLWVAFCVLSFRFWAGYTQTSVPLTLACVSGQILACALFSFVSGFLEALRQDIPCPYCRKKRS